MTCFWIDGIQMNSANFSYPKLKPVAKHKVRIYTATYKYHMRRFFIREKKMLGIGWSTYATKASVLTSIINMALSVPAIIKSNSEFSICSVVGLITNWPLIRPILTPAIVCLFGISERALQWKIWGKLEIKRHLNLHKKKE